MSSKFVKQIDGKPTDFQLQNLIEEADCNFNPGGMTVEQAKQLAYSYNQSEQNKLPLDFLHNNKMSTNVCQWETFDINDLRSDMDIIIAGFGFGETRNLYFNSGNELLRGYELKKKIFQTLSQTLHPYSSFTPHKAGTYIITCRLNLEMDFNGYPPDFNKAYMYLKMYKNNVFVKRLDACSGWTFVKEAEAILLINLNFYMCGTASINLNPGDEVTLSLYIDFTAYATSPINTFSGAIDFDAAFINNQNVKQINNSYLTP